MAKSGIQSLKKLCEAIREGKSDGLWGNVYRILEQEKFLDTEYVENTGDNSIDDVKQNIDMMTFKECCTWLTWILRGERFCEGLFQSCANDGSLLSLLKRACELLEA